MRLRWGSAICRSDLGAHHPCCQVDRKALHLPGRTGPDPSHLGAVDHMDRDSRLTLGYQLGWVTSWHGKSVVLIRRIACVCLSCITAESATPRTTPKTSNCVTLALLSPPA